MTPLRTTFKGIDISKEERIINLDPFISTKSAIDSRPTPSGSDADLWAGTSNGAGGTKWRNGFADVLAEGD